MKLVLTTVGTARAARTLAEALLAERRCACVSILPGVESRYWWKGRREMGREHLLLLKTSPRALPRLRRRLVELHPYEVPEVLVLDTRASQAYAAWLVGEIKAR